MILFDENLYNLQQQTARKKHLETVRNSLYDQKRELDKNLFNLKCARNKEQTDVDKLEKPSLSNFFYKLTGKMEEKLNQEQQEAYEASLRYDNAFSEVERITQKISEITEEINTLRNIEKEFFSALEAKKSEINALESPEKEELLKLEKQLISLQAQETEINEALSAGSRCLFASNSVIENLKKASDWGTWDLIGGGSMSTLIKHDYMHKAQSSVSVLQTELRYFRSELADVKIYSSLYVQTDTLTQFADFFFDNIFIDVSVQDRIKSSLRSVTDTKSQIQNAISKLNTLLSQNETKQTDLKKQIENYLIGK